MMMKLLLIIPIHIADAKLKNSFIERMRKHLEPIIDRDTFLDITCLPPGATSSIECRIDRNIYFNFGGLEIKYVLFFDLNFISRQKLVCFLPVKEFPF